MIATDIVNTFDAEKCDIERIEIAGPGFINFFVKSTSFSPLIKHVLEKENDYGKQTYGQGKKYNVELEVRSSLEPQKPGTIVKEIVKMEKMLIRGVACDKNVSRISIVGLSDHPGTAFKVFNALGQAKINVDIILQSIGRHNTKDITFTVSQDNRAAAVEVIESMKDSLCFNEVTFDEDVSKVSIVGAGMESNPGVAAKMFEALYDAGINIRMISTSEIKVSVLIDEKYADAAVIAVHDKFVI